MKKKILSVALLAVMVLSLTLAGCGTGSSGSGGEQQGGNGKIVGVAMPTQSSERWIKDGRNMKARLEELGYEVFLQYAEDDVQVQLAQIETMIAMDVDCLVVAAVDSSALINALKTAKEVGIPVISYDRLLMNTDSVDYYASFDNEGVGRKIGEYIEEKANLAEATEPLTIEFFMGSPDDNNAVLLYKGVMSVLQKYLDDGTLVCKSGRTSFEETCILRWSQEVALQNCENYLSGFYADDKLDICCSAFDGFAYGIKAALEEPGTRRRTGPSLPGRTQKLWQSRISSTASRPRQFSRIRSSLQTSVPGWYRQ